MVAAELGRRAPLPKRLHSLSGVIPLGVFLVLHIWVTASVAGSRDVYDRQVSFLHGGPIQGLLEVLLVLAPLTYHAAYGVWRALSRSPEDHAYTTDLMRSLQRVSGIIVLVFVVLHLWEFRAQTWTRGLPVDAYSTKLVEHLSWTRWGVPWIAFGYVIGLAATTFHLANGLTSFFTAWGIATGHVARHRMRLFTRAIGLLLFAISTAMVIQLATGNRIFPAIDPAPPVCGSAVPTPAPATSLSASP